MPNKPKPRPLFVYGPLCAAELLAWALTGDTSNTSTAAALVQPRPARVYKFRCVAHRTRDIPCAVQDRNGFIQGFLLQPMNIAQRKKLDDFERGSHRMVSVSVFMPSGHEVEADMFIWDGDSALATNAPWSFEAFKREGLQEWIDTYQGMEIIGEDG